jgi:hypothetical protein
VSALIATVLILSAFCGLLGLIGWLVERKRRDPMAHYQTRWQIKGFRGW